MRQRLFPTWLGLAFLATVTVAIAGQTIMLVDGCGAVTTGGGGGGGQATYTIAFTLTTKPPERLADFKSVSFAGPAGLTVEPDRLTLASTPGELSEGSVTRNITIPATGSGQNKIDIIVTGYSATDKELSSTLISAFDNSKAIKVALSWDESVPQIIANSK